MPELPEVQSVVNALAPHLPGRIITAVHQTRLDIASLSAFRRSGPGLDLAPLLTSRTITAVYRRAKRVVLSLDNAAAIYFHLGMTGHLALVPAEPSLNPPSETHKPQAPRHPHTHLTLALSPPPPICSLESSSVIVARSPSCPTSPFSLDPSSLLLSFSDPRRFGKVVYLPPGEALEGGGRGLGPEPLTLAPDHFHRLLQTARRPLKAALLDQRLLAGVGNIYADEALHAAGLHPRRKASALSAADAGRLLAALQSVLTAAIAANGSTLRDYRTPDNAPGSFQVSHRVYARTHQPCPTCQTPIRKTTLAQRSTHFCPTCQPYRRPLTPAAQVPHPSRRHPDPVFSRRRTGDSPDRRRPPPPHQHFKIDRRTHAASHRTPQHSATCVTASVRSRRPGLPRSG